MKTFVQHINEKLSLNNQSKIQEFIKLTDKQKQILKSTLVSYFLRPATYKNTFYEYHYDILIKKFKGDIYKCITRDDVGIENFKDTTVLKFNLFSKLKTESDELLNYIKDHNDELYEYVTNYIDNEQ